MRFHGVTVLRPRFEALAAEAAALGYPCADTLFGASLAEIELRLKAFAAVRGGVRPHAMRDDDMRAVMLAIAERDNVPRERKAAGTVCENASVP